MSDADTFECDECGEARPRSMQVSTAPPLCSECFDGAHDGADGNVSDEAGPGSNGSEATDADVAVAVGAGEPVDFESGRTDQSTGPEVSADQLAGSDGAAADDDAGDGAATDADTPDADAGDADAGPGADDGVLQGNGELRFWDDASPAALSVVEQEQATRRGAGEDGENGSSPLDRRIDSWREQLLDLTRRNTLIDYSETKTKSLALHRPDALSIAETLVEGGDLYVRKSAEEPDGIVPPDPGDVKDNEVASTRSRAETQRALYRMGLKQTRAQEEKGVDALHVAFGFLEWYDEEGSDDPMTSPLFVLAVDLERTPTRSADQHDFAISPLDMDLRLNPALRKKLEAERGLFLPADETFVLDELAACVALVEDRVQGYDRWSLHGDVCLGVFDFTKFGLYQDIETNREAVKDHPLIKGINGDPSALPSPPETPRAHELDASVPSEDVHQVLDADSSQQEAIEAAKAGMDFVLQGPPGTGKSQTIANVIAEKLAAGETVLFVSEKRAALDVVKDRLDDVGVGRFCLEAHGENASKKAVLESFESELKSDPIRKPADRREVVETLDRIRRDLNGYGEQLFWTPEGQDITPYEAFGGVSRYTDRPSFGLDFEDPLAIPQETIDGWLDALETLSNYRYEIANYHDHPWRATTLDTWHVNTKEEVDRILEATVEATRRVRDASDAFEDALNIEVESLAGVRDAGHLLRLIVRRPDASFEPALFEPAFYDRPERLAEFAEKRRTLADHRAHLAERYHDSLFEASGQELYHSLSEFGRMRHVKPSYRSLRKEIVRHARPEYDPDFEDLTADMRRLLELQELESTVAEYTQLQAHLGSLDEGDDTDWDLVIDVQQWIAQFEAIESVLKEPVRDALVSGVFEDADDLEALRETVQSAADHEQDALDDLRGILDLDAVTVEGAAIETASLGAVEEYLQGLAANQGALQDWIEFEQRLSEARTGRLEGYLTSFLEGGHAPEDLVPCFKKALYTQWLNAAYGETELGTFSATEFQTAVDRFRRLDRQQQEYAKVAIQHAVTQEYPRVELEHAESSEQVFLRREINKSRQHKPLRTLFREVPNLATTLKPCFMMSPLSVAQYIEYGTISFDTVIFDEASQVMPQDAVSSLIRADQVIIAGDSQQLPPTKFFEADVESAADVPEDLESILDEAASVLPERQLRWHYRSRTNELIDFSNSHYYDDRLRTFPDNAANGDAKGVEFEYVPEGCYDRGGTRTNPPEASRVVDLIEDHVAEDEDASLGVVAFSSAQADAIREEIEARRGDAPALDAFVTRDDTLEGFFVKSLENVQGDERDALVMSVGYGPDESGEVSMNFGPLNHTGGERRLNVAVTRARERITVVSSITHEDVDLARTDSRGVRDFKRYLEYAQRGGDGDLADAADTPPDEAFDSPFPRAVFRALEAEGFEVWPHDGSSGYSFDMAIADPDDPGRAVLAIECDGSAYRASKTARDRDRTRQAVLESLGWELHRIWAPDWASNREAEIDEIVERVERLSDGDVPARDDPGDDVYEIDPEPMDAAELEGYRDHVVEYEAPAVPERQHGEYDDATIDERKAVLLSLVEAHGPIDEETALKQAVRAWGVSRVSADLREDMAKIAWDLQRDGEVVERDGFLWPTKVGAIDVRVNTEDDKRPIDRIPLEELGKAAYVLLDNGGTMTREDVVVEVARLFGYARTGSRIEARLTECVDQLVDAGAAEETDAGRLAAVDCDVDRALLS